MPILRFRLWRTPVSLFKTIVAVALATALSTAMAQVPTPPTTQPGPVPVPPAATAEADGMAHPLDARDANTWLDGFMPYALEASGIPGAVVVVVKDGQVLTSRGFGYADRENRTPVDPATTLFRIGSVSKLFTWTAVMQMVEAGKIDLDADINRYLDFTIPPRAGKPVTMRQLMQHVAGFEEQSKGIMTEDPRSPGFETVLKRWVPQRVFDAGTTPAYSNYGATLAGYIVQRVSGQPYDDYLDDHIFKPLGMTHATARQPLPAALSSSMAKGYVFGEDKPRAFEIVGPAPAGSMSASGEDMARFMIAHLQGGTYQGARLLGEAATRQMHDSPLTLLPPLNRMELGFFETNINHREVIGHLGDTVLFHTALHLFLRENVGLYVSFNSGGRDGAAGSLRTAILQRFADRYFPAPEDTARVDPETSAKHAAMLVGHWDNSRVSKSTFLAALNVFVQPKIELDAEHHLVTPFKGVDGTPLKWVETEPFVWRAVGGHERLAAKVVDGKVTRFSIDLVSPFMVFERPAAGQNGAWLVPALLAAAVALLLTVLTWPVTALVRRHYHVPANRSVPARRAYRLSRIAALSIVVALVAWAALVLTLFSHLSYMSDASNGVLRAVQVFGIVAFVGGWLAMLPHLVTVWRGPSRWPARIWSVVLVLSASVVLWFAWTFALLRVSVLY
ncbi:serine hydrolase domain-containing protein [Luteibacter sp. Lutesp34]|uniref:serine hydrolase domain-containing protein n=1 Tax=Luteibacter sp. Lutesp34 TaxID=3243030 RepID=UPI0039B39366